MIFGYPLRSETWGEHGTFEGRSVAQWGAVWRSIRYRSHRYKVRLQAGLQPLAVLNQRKGVSRMGFAAMLVPQPRRVPHPAFSPPALTPVLG
ncbi:hypothetical protein [Nitrosospira sp. Is2]|uniref:hypothetical protein n=1 Tax=Nitrosospira sp. Is2 TaxID=3080532 RepID=UPI002953D147|nr:hypothetical protein [Nitrosospira sp. Is2]WON73785.1 hypothetical protein R5L00_15090 [Nitrosospira sp. Is2]